MSYKQYDNAKSRGSERKQPEIVSGSAFNTLTSSSYSVSLVNSTLLQVGASSNEAEAGYVTGYLDFPSLLFDNGAYAMIEDTFDNVIASFNAARGYTSGITKLQIRNYLIASARAYAILISYWRYYNGKAIVDRTGKDFGSLVTTRIRSISTSATIKSIIENTAISTVLENGSDNNVVWGQTYLSKLNLIKMPSSWFKLIKDLLEGVFFIETSQVPSYMVLYDNVLNTNASHATRFAAEIAAINVIRTASPAIDSFFHFFGFEAEGVNDDYSRDLKGQTLPIKVDASITDLLSNGAWADFSNLSTDDDVKYLISGHPVGIAPFNVTDHLDIQSSNLTHLLLMSRKLSNTVSIMPAAHYYRVGFGWIETYLLNPHSLSSLVTDGSISTTDILIRYAGALNSWYLFINAPLGYLPELDLAVAGGFCTVTNVIANIVAEGGGTYVLPVDILYLGQSTQLNNLFGMDWRIAIQQKISSLPLSPLSGIQ